MLKQRGSYLVGPMARYNLNFDRLPASVQALAGECGLGPSCRNPFKSIVIRAIEVVYACEEALAPDRGVRGARGSRRAARSRGPGSGMAAPRRRAASSIIATCWTRTGSIREARIVPPTSQNQLSIEEDIREVASGALDLADDALRDRCEQTIRNYDPCISCSCHFLRLAVHRE